MVWICDISFHFILVQSETVSMVVFHSEDDVKSSLFLFRSFCFISVVAIVVCIQVRSFQVNLALFPSLAQLENN